MELLRKGKPGGEGPSGNGPSPASDSPSMPRELHLQSKQHQVLPAVQRSPSENSHREGQQEQAAPAPAAEAHLATGPLGMLGESFNWLPSPSCSQGSPPPLLTPPPSTAVPSFQEGAAETGRPWKQALLCEREKQKATETARAQCLSSSIARAAGEPIAVRLFVRKQGCGSQNRVQEHAGFSDILTRKESQVQPGIPGANVGETGQHSQQPSGPVP